MSSNQELINNSNRQISPHFKLQFTPIAPKIIVDDIYLEEIYDFKEPSGGIDQPEFVSAKWISTQKSESNRSKKLKYTHAQSVVQKNINQECTIYQSQQEDNTLMTLLKGAIWICYFLSTMQTNFQNISILLIANIISVFIASILSLKNMINGQPIAVDLLHGLSLVTSVTLHFYSVGNPQDPFVISLHVVRSLRLLFILNVNHTFKDFVLRYAKFIKKIIKVSIPLIAVILIICLIFGQAATEDINNRCRLNFSLGNNSFPIPTDQRLCGSRQCSQNQLCLNPTSFNFNSNRKEYQNSSILAFGFFTFNNLYHGFFSVFSLGTLSNTASITSIFSNSLPGYMMALLTISAILLFHFGFLPQLVVLIESLLVFNDSQFETLSGVETQKSEEGSQAQIRSFNKRKTQDNIISVAPTFGNLIPQQKNGDKQEKQLAKTRKNSQKRLSIDLIEFQNPKIGASVKFQQIKEEIQEETTKEINKEEPSNWLNICKQYTLIVGAIILASSQFMLLLLFALRVLSQRSNQIIGISLSCFFIVWSVKLGMVVFDKYFDSQSNQEEGSQATDQNQELIFKIESFIYLVNLFDYVCRIFQQVYLLEQPSIITPIATAALLLRILYPFLLSSNFGIFIQQLKAFANIQNNIWLYVVFMFVVSAIIATLTMQIDGNNKFVVQIVRHFTSFSNQNWLSFYNNSSTLIQKDSQGYNFAIKFVLIVLGQIFMLKFIYASAVAIGLARINEQTTTILPSIQVSQERTSEQIVEIVKAQKTFWILSYSQNSLRSTLHNLLKYGVYQSLKEKILIIYLIFVFGGHIFGKSSDLYIYFMLTADCFLLIDSFLSIIVFRFWGQQSFSNYKSHPIINLISSCLLIASLFASLQLQFLRVFRITMLFSVSKDLDNAFKIIKAMFRTSFKMLPLFMLIIAFFFIICLTTSVASNSTNKIQWALKAPFLALELLKKGFDLPLMLNISTKGSYIISFQSAILSLMMSIPFNCLCVVFMLKLFSKHQQELQRLHFKSFKKSKPYLRRNLEQIHNQFENQKLKEKILSIVPPLMPQNYVEDNYFLKLTSSKSKFYRSTKISIVVINAVILIISYLINGTVSQQTMADLKLARIFFVLLELLTFVVECLGHKGNKRNFMLMTTIYVISLPGAFITILPFSKFVGSKQLKQFLLIFIAATPLSLINTMLILGGSFTNVASFIYQKLTKTLWVLFFILLISSFFGDILSLLFKEETLVATSYALIGLFGGNQQYSLSMNQLSTVKLVGATLINTSINLIGFVLRNGLIACAIFQISDKVRQNLRPINLKAKDLSTSSFNLFDQDRFIQLWSTIDPKGKGYISYSICHHYLHHFLKFFRLYPQYIEFLVTSKSNIANLKLSLLRQLCLPIRTALEDGQYQYVVTMYDLIARLLCFSLAQNTNEQHLQGNNQDKANNQQIKHHLPSILGFSQNDWNTEVAERIESFNSVRKEEWEIQEKYIILRNIDMNSSQMASVIKVLPRMRKHAVAAKQKVKPH